MSSSQTTARLARDGGAPARTRPEPPMYPGGLMVADAELEALRRVVETQCLFRYYGPRDTPSEVAAYEREWAQSFGAAHALAVNSGSGALVCALVAVGLEPGDEVILPAYTWNATANVVVQLGGVPVLAEVDETLLIDPADVARKVTGRTRAILPVHMRGAPCDMDALAAIAREHGLAIVEDSCQAVGASYHGKRTGTIGDAGAYSTQYHKVITTGEGGMFVTADEERYLLALDVHDCAGSWRRAGELPRFPGFNFRLSELQGAVGRVQLERLGWLLGRMRHNHARLRERVEGLPGVELRASNDPAGDAGLALIAFAANPGLAADACDALEAEGVHAIQLYRPDASDLHIYPYWKPILDRLDALGRPRPDCPRTLELLERTVHVDVSPLLEDPDVDEIALAFEKVSAAVLA